ncbi:hypothetical protein [Lentisalinibacter sediminis]|uniref:hypothetical protein n=1 Tax=Lentisalinibacter sediminis TaxID=2992237 RepID=UPI0038649A26
MLPIEAPIMADRAHANHRRYAALRPAGRTAGRLPARENNGREALAREQEPARRHASTALTSRGENDSTHHLDR